MRVREFVIWISLPIIGATSGYLTYVMDTSLMGYVAILYIGLIGLWAFYTEVKHPFAAVYSIYLSIILLHTTATPYVSGYGDAHFEYYYAAEALASGWDFSSQGLKQSLLSLNIAVPTYTVVSGLSLTSTFTYLIPMIVAGTGPVLMLMYRSVVGRTGLAPVLLIAFGSRALLQGNGAGLTRQALTILCVVFALWLLYRRDEGDYVFSLLAILFLSLGIAHYYATGFFYVAYLFAGGAAVFLYQYLPKRVQQFAPGLSPQRGTVTVTIVVLAGVFVAQYYWITGSQFYEILFGQITYVIINVLSFSQSATASIATSSSRALPYTFEKFVYYIEILTIAAGFLIVLRRRSNVFPVAYYITAAASFGLLGATTVLPYFFFDTKRLITIMIVLCAPFFVVSCRWLREYTKKRTNLVLPPARSVIMVFLAVAFLLNMNVVASAMGLAPVSAPLAQNSIDEQSSSEQIGFYNHINGYEEGVAMARFMNQNTSYQESGVYIDTLSTMTLMSYGRGGNDGWFVRGGIPLPAEKDGTRYTALGPTTGRLDLYARLSFGEPQEYSRDDIKPLLTTQHRIYSSGNSSIYYG